MLSINARNDTTLDLTAKRLIQAKRFQIYYTSSDERSFNFSGQKFLGFNFKVAKKENMEVV